MMATRWQRIRGYLKIAGSSCLAVATSLAGVSVAVPLVAPWTGPVAAVIGALGGIAHALAFDLPRDQWSQEKRLAKAGYDDEMDGTPPEGTKKP